MAGVDMDLVMRKQHEIENRSNFKDVPYFKFKEDGIYVLRFLPPFGEARQFWREFQKSFGVGPNEKHIVPLAQFGLDCPLQKRIDELNKAGDEVSKKEAAKMRPKSRVAMVVIDRKHEDVGPQILETNLDVFRDILTIMADPDYGDITDPEKGTDIQINYKKVGQRGAFPDYVVLAKRNSSKLTDNPQLLSTWLGTDWLEESGIGKASDAGYIEAVLAGTEVAYNDARKKEREAAKAGTETQQQAAQTYAAPPPAAPPMFNAPVAPAAPVVTHRFLAGTKLWTALNGAVVETTVEAICERLKTEKPEAVQLMAYDQNGGWQTAAAMGFAVTVPAPAPAAPAAPPPPLSPPVSPPAMPAVPGPPAMGGSSQVPFDLPPSEAHSLSAQLAAFGPPQSMTPQSQVARDILLALGGK